MRSLLIPSSAVGVGTFTLVLELTVEVMDSNVLCCPAMLSSFVAFRFVRRGVASWTAFLPSGFCKRS